MTSKLKEDMDNVVLEVDEKQEKTAPPMKYSIVFFNDDFTPFECVIFILINIFNKTNEQAHLFAQKVHNEGKAVVGTYSKDLASQKYKLTQDLILKMDVPLFINVVAE